MTADDRGRVAVGRAGAHQNARYAVSMKVIEDLLGSAQRAIKLKKVRKAL